jgi:Domain of unknown function (DUF4158)
MDNLGKRLIILSRDEIEALYGRPRFTQEERGEYFSLTPAETGALEQLRFINAKIYFILQLAISRLATCSLPLTAGSPG